MDDKKDEISIYQEMGIGDFEDWLTIVHWKATLGGALLFGIVCVGLADWLGCVEKLLRNTLLSTLLTCLAYLALLGIIYALTKHPKIVLMVMGFVVLFLSSISLLMLMLFA